MVVAVVAVVATMVAASPPLTVNIAVAAPSTPRPTPLVSVHGVFTPVTGDFDCDGRDDVFWYAAGRSQDFVWYSTATRGFVSHQYTVFGAYRPLGGDFNGDGCGDIFWYAPGAGTDSMWYGSASKVFTSADVHVYGNYTPLAGDFDADGSSDIWWFDRDGGATTNSIWYGSPSKAFTTVATNLGALMTSIGAGPTRPVVGDFDGNGHSDVLFYRPGSVSAAYVYGTDHRGIWSPHVHTTPGDDLVPVVGDFDAGGSSDILWYGRAGAPDYAWFTVPGSSPQLSVVRRRTNIVSPGYVPFAADFDGNATSDLFWYAPGSGIDVVWQNVDHDLPHAPPPAPSAIGAGGEHACAITNGALKCWGDNRYGELGAGTYSKQSFVPVAVRGLSSGVTAVAVGFGFTCAIAHGGAWCWGLNQDGELGDGTTTRSSVPVRVVGLASGVTSISASVLYSGEAHTCAVVGGAAKCWGFNRDGELGDGTTTSRSTPVQVVGLTGGVTSISAGDFSSCAIVAGSAKCWGRNESGQLGDASTATSLRPVQVAGLTSGVTHLDAARRYACALVVGAAKCWGINDEGELGDGTTTSSAIPVQVVGLASGTTSLSARERSACVIASGAVRCWGLAFKSVPSVVLGLTSGATAVSAGAVMCAIVSGTAECWGLDDHGQRGDGVIVSAADSSRDTVPAIVLHP